MGIFNGKIQRSVKGWLNEDFSQWYQHSNNVSRRDNAVEQLEDPVEAQTEAFFQQGKNIGGMVSSVTLFRSMVKEDPRSKDEGEISDYVLRVQASSVDDALGGLDAKHYDPGESDKEAYKRCRRMMKFISERDKGDLNRKRALLKSGNAMASLALKEVGVWMQMAEQNAEGTLPTLSVNNGGHPRSVGPRVEKFQPIFHKILESEQYQALT